MTKQELVKIRSKALRTKTWFSALSKVERAIVDLTIRCVEEVRSMTLTATITAIIDKISEFLQEDFMVRAERVGYAIVESLLTACEKWRSKDFSAWRQDKVFIRFMGISAIMQNQTSIRN